MKLEKYQQDKVIVILQTVYWILLILKKNYILIAVDLSKQKALDVDSSVIQQIIFTGKASQNIVKILKGSLLL